MFQRASRFGGASVARFPATSQRATRPAKSGCLCVSLVGIRVVLRLTSGSRLSLRCAALIVAGGEIDEETLLQAGVGDILDAMEEDAMQGLKLAPRSRHISCFNLHGLRPLRRSSTTGWGERAGWRGKQPILVSWCHGGAVLLRPSASTLMPATNEEPAIRFDVRGGFGGNDRQR